ncbi:MAG: hypothetical protein M3P49_02230 [Actinomycetota bacterium]|nr:hypothetical protein [Actinomycetota bacterium]
MGMVHEYRSRIRTAPTIALYDDLRRASAGWDGGGYPVICLCDERAEERGAAVSLVDTFGAGEKMYREECGRPNQGSAEGDPAP